MTRTRVAAIVGATLLLASCNLAGRDAPPDAVLATTGDEPAIFANAIAARDDGGAALSLPFGSVEVAPDQGDGAVCLDIELPRSSGDGCFGADVIEAGVAFLVAEEHGDPTIIVGIAPDEVSRVEVAGVLVDVDGNVWWRQLPAGSDIRVAMTSDVTGASVTVG